MNENFTTHPRENVGAGDFTVQQSQMMQGPDRWAVVQYTGSFYKTLYTLPTRSAAKREALREWKAALKAHRR